MTLARFLGGHPIGRRITIVIHRWPLHPGWKHPLRFTYNGCWLCYVMVKSLMSDLPPFTDQSSIKLSDPIYDAEGKLVRRGISMTATAQRQLEAIMADPEKAASIQKAIDQIAE